MIRHVSTNKSIFPSNRTFSNKSHTFQPWSDPRLNVSSQISYWSRPITKQSLFSSDRKSHYELKAVRSRSTKRRIRSEQKDRNRMKNVMFEKEEGFLSLKSLGEVENFLPISFVLFILYIFILVSQNFIIPVENYLLILFGAISFCITDAFLPPLIFVLIRKRKWL